MNVSGLLASLKSIESYRTLRAGLASGPMPPPLDLLRAARPFLLAALACDLQRPMLVVAGSVERAKTLVHSLRDWSSAADHILRFPEPLTLFYERAPWTDDVIVDRLRVLSALHSQSATRNSPLIIASARALMQRTLPVRQFRVSIRHLRVGQTLGLERALNRWAGLGYEPVSVVEAPGQFSHRG
ncbi:MAG: hypothetical protein U9R15_07650, partial [Chloroflexota bacterium]|nr:hypothetical protein [Chloroflexota bacterium]